MIRRYSLELYDTEFREDQSKQFEAILQKNIRTGTNRNFSQKHLSIVLMAHVQEWIKFRRFEFYNSYLYQGLISGRHDVQRE